MAVALSTPTVAPLNNGSTTTTISFASTNQPLYVRICGWLGGASISGVTYGGVALTKVADSTLSSGQDLAYIWRLASPTAGTANIVTTLSGGTSQAGSVAAANTTGQDTVTPEGTAVTNKSAGTGTGTGSLAVSGAATGDLTIVAIVNGNGAAITPSATGAGTTTEDFDSPSNGEGAEGFKATDAATAVSGSWTGSTSWAIAAIPLKVAAATTATFPFQRPARRDPWHPARAWATSR